MIPLPAVGALTLYTDGLTEGHNGTEQQRLGVDGLITLIERFPSTEPAAHVDRLIKEVYALNAGRHTDDLAVLHLAWGRPAPRAAHASEAATAGTTAASDEAKAENEV